MTIQPTTLPTPCYRCTGAPISWVPGVPTDGLCLGCRGEAARNRQDARDELVVTVGNMDRPDIRLMPLTGPQSGW